MAYVVTVPDQPTLPVETRTIYFSASHLLRRTKLCAHAIEMGHTLIASHIFFQKNQTTACGAPFPSPRVPGRALRTRMIVAEFRRHRHSGQKALDCVYGYGGVGHDPRPSGSQKMGRPWEIGKAFGSA